MNNPFDRFLDNAYRHASAPYPSRGHRGGRSAVLHHNRTLHLNAAASPANTGSASASPDPPAGWVAKNDRHRQLINASVFEKESQSRTKAIEETRKRRLNSQRLKEKTRLKQFLDQVGGANNVPNPQAVTGTNEITIEGIRFRVTDGGKKLVKIQGMTSISRPQ